jgi:hypothetical protein
MATTIKDIKEWLDRAPKNATHMMVVCDTFSYEDYPVFVSKTEKVKEEYAKYHGPNMQKVMEVYNLKKSLKNQLNSTGRNFNF